MNRDPGFPSGFWRRYYSIGFYEPDHCENHIIIVIGLDKHSKAIFGCLHCGVRYASLPEYVTKEDEE